MNRNAAILKFTGVMSVVVAISFSGTWAAGHSRRTGRGSGVIATSINKNVVVSPVNTPSVTLSEPGWNAVFELDNNAFDDSAAGLPDDWSDLNVDPLSVNTSGFVTGHPGGSAVWTFVSDPAIRTDLIYTGGGSKDFNDISSWSNVARGTGPDKDDVEHAFAAKYVNNVAGPSFGHDILVFGGDRPTNNGDANIGFWFFQNPVVPNGSGGFTSRHANGDIFVLSAFSGGGGTSTIRVLVWVGTPDTAGPGGTDSGAVARCTAFGAGSFIDVKSDSTSFPDGTLCDITATAPNAGIGFTNGGDIHVSWQYKNKDNKTTCTNPDTTATSPCVIPTPDFFEGAIDLTVLHLSTECISSFLLETRSSQEVSAVLKDFALGGFNTCSCSLAPQSACSGQNAQFCATNPAGTTAPYHYAWTGPHGAISTDAQCITVTGATSADAGSYGVTIMDAHGIAVSCSAALTIGQGPTAAVSGGGEYCVSGTANIRLDLAGTGPWTVTWSDIGQQTYSTTPVTRTVSPTVTTTYSVSAVSDANTLGCAGSTSGSATVVVDANPVPSINTVACSDSTSISLTASCAGGGCGFSWVASNGGNILTGFLSSTITLDRAGRYTVTASVPHTNAPTCTATASRNVGLCAAGQ